jgi:hypothetical protein
LRTSASACGISPKRVSFTAIAAGSPALGIGGSTAMYSVIYAATLDPFPYKDPDRLMSVTFLDIAERTTVFRA